MIDIETGEKPNVIVAKASGTVTADDYASILIPAIEQASAAGEKLRFLFVLGPGFDGYEGAAALDDERIGLVTDHEAYRGLAKAFGFLMPGEVRVFTLAGRADAEDWITGA
jgi:SpoIIAA-like